MRLAFTRTISLGTGTRVGSFRYAVRNQDRRCVITGKETVNFDLSSWKGLEAAHVFPLAYERIRIKDNYDRWITTELTHGGSINSDQNGMLLKSDIYGMFDSYEVLINPDVWIPCFSLKSISG